MDKSQQKLVGVFGLGMSGLAAARYLQRTDQQFFVVDTRAKPPGEKELASLNNCFSHYFGDIPQELLNSANMIIVSPGIDSNIAPLNQARKNGVDIVGDVEIFARQTKGKIVAITGSNGKSTVTDLTYQLLKAAGANVAIGGNFGVPVLDFLPLDQADIYVLELSSFQLDTTRSLKAEVATVLNISEDHMDRYTDLTAYQNSKLTIYQGAKKCVVNLDDKQTDYRGDRNRKQDNEISNVVEFSLTNHDAKYHTEMVDKRIALLNEEQVIVYADQLKISGAHNLSNALAAIALVKELGFSFCDSMNKCLRNYSGLAHRFELVESANNCVWINDSKATNVGATLAALNGIQPTVKFVILIAGGDAKGSDLTPLKHVLNTKVNKLILIGKDAKLFAEMVPEDRVYFAKDMPDAVQYASKLVTQQVDSESLVLLSPACASLDMYSSYVARGEAFIDAVRACA
ncbi:UDP-N-acetylmuramoyl-L-alanine--D-glutamate ligase [Aliikangiella marina]|uniref:UDP-N-acetylmuramoylalanine--D-glutamate ligase n=1 Tax=Aliikangiella marina TaxID=1712262 RepID=A0A545TDI9_9GAMM|nr:UDP-N-acetylmuramoyl-L-alanine--D-glutamate ligase [Aliikangiella marina]TQV75280.1 UDP-N-acetylmuramoyl-L-alanine--D-glutamate ligase [Aliikangiella marina]